MSERSSDTATPPQKTDRAEAGLTAERDGVRVPSDAATPTAASAASVSEDTVDDDKLRPTAETQQPEPQDGSPGQATVAVGEVEVECPGCGLVLVGDQPRATAAWFCPRCDFPAFWARPPASAPTPQPRARRRLPGTAGTQVLGAAACWNCGEMNEPDVTACLRCAATLPKPVSPVAEQVVVEVPVSVPVPYVVQNVVWPFVAAGVLAGAALAASGALAALRFAGVLATAAPLLAPLGGLTG